MLVFAAPYTEVEEGHFNRGGTFVFATHVVMFLKRTKKVFAHTIFQLFGLFLVNM